MEDTTMKKNILTMAVLLIASAAVFTACSSDDNVTGEQPANPTGKYTMTINASKGDDATTRGLYFADGEVRKNLSVNWNGKEKIRVVQNGAVIGTLSAAMSSNESTTLTGTVTGFQNDRAIGFYLLADEDGKMDYTGQNGAMLDENGTGNIEENYDYASYELTGPECQQAFTTDGSNIVPKDGAYIPFASQQAIVRFELQKSDGSTLFASKFFVTDKNTGKLVQSIDAKSGTKTYGHVTLTPSGLSTSSIYYVAMNLEGNTSDIRLFAQAQDQYGNPELYVFEKGNVTFTKGKYYRVTVKMSRCTKFPLSQITHEDTQFTGWYIGSVDNESAYQLGGSVNAVIAYVGKVPGYFDNFLAISMHDCKTDGTEGREAYKNWRHYTTANSVGKYAASHPIKIGDNTYNTASYFPYVNSNPIVPITYDEVANNNMTASNTNSTTLKGWRMPTITDWRYILYGLCGSPSPTDPAGVVDQAYLGTTNPLDILNDSPGYGLDLSNDGIYYCTSSGVSGQTEYVWYLRFNKSTAPLVRTGSDGGAYCYLRPVFAY